MCINYSLLYSQESDTGLGPPALWDLAADKQTLQSEQPLQVARCTKIINADTEDSKYIINVKQFAKFVVDLAEQVASTDIEEGMRVGVDRNKYQVSFFLARVRSDEPLKLLYSLANDGFRFFLF